jgi:hypothetical protein
MTEQLSNGQIHNRMRKLRPKTGVCEECGREGYTELSNKDHRYTLDIEDWQELCRTCHTLYDYETFGPARLRGAPSSKVSPQRRAELIIRHEAQERARKLQQGAGV